MRDLYELRSDTMGEILELKAKIPTLSQRLTELEIRSPIDGEVNRVFLIIKGLCYELETLWLKLCRPLAVFR